MIECIYHAPSKPFIHLNQKTSILSFYQPVKEINNTWIKFITKGKVLKWIMGC